MQGEVMDVNEVFSPRLDKVWRSISPKHQQSVLIQML